MGENAEGAARVHQVLLGAGHIHQVEETAVAALGGGRLLLDGFES